MASLRPHRRFNFVGLWRYGFILSGILIALALVGFIASAVVSGSPLTLGTEFSGGTSIEITGTGDITEDQVKEAFATAASEAGVEMEVSSVQTTTSAQSGNGFLIRTNDTESTNANKVMNSVEEQLGIDDANVQIETIGASWGASVIWSSIMAFIVSCIVILAVIAVRYREPRMGAVALVTLFHDMIIILGIYAWAGLFFHMEITSDVIAALLAIIGYSLYDTIVIFHRIDKNSSPTMKCSLKTCANRSVNEVIVRSMNTSITSILPVLFMLILGTDTLKDFAFAMFCGMVIGFYSTLAISAPVFTLWKCRQPEFAKLESKYPYEVEQSPFTTEMMKQARIDSKRQLAEEKKLAAEKAREEKRLAAEAKAAREEAEKAKAAEKAAAEKAAAEKAEAEKAGAEKAEAEKAEAEAEEAAEEALSDTAEAPKAVDAVESVEAADGSADSAEAEAPELEQEQEPAAVEGLAEGGQPEESASDVPEEAPDGQDTVAADNAVDEAQPEAEEAQPEQSAEAEEPEAAAQAPAGTASFVPVAGGGPSIPVPAARQQDAPEEQ